MVGTSATASVMMRKASVSEAVVPEAGSVATATACRPLRSTSLLAGGVKVMTVLSAAPGASVTVQVPAALL